MWEWSVLGSLSQSGRGLELGSRGFQPIRDVGALWFLHESLFLIPGLLDDELHVSQLPNDIESSAAQ